ncbi:hypothetical protein U1Q18_004625 [Sarracenia purpurea var. burkii]
MAWSASSSPATPSPLCRYASPFSLIRHFRYFNYQPSLPAIISSVRSQPPNPCNSTHHSIPQSQPQPSSRRLKISQNSNFNRSLTVRSHLNSPLISPQDHWGIWTALFSIGAFGLWSEKTNIGAMVSAALVSTLVGLGASNLGIIPYEAPAYTVVMEYLLPLIVPLLLFRADMRQVMSSTGTLLLAFLIGSVATMVGTLVAFLVVPMRSLGHDSWKIAAALMGSYIGGAVNFIAISEALGVSPSVLAAGVAADNVISAIFFVVLFTLASKIPSEASASTSGK